MKGNRSLWHNDKLDKKESGDGVAGIGNTKGEMV